MRSILLLLFILVFSAWADSRISPEALNIMKQLKTYYSDNKTDVYIEQILKTKNLNEEETELVHEAIEDFFDSEIFVETGAMYLTALFRPQELEQLRSALKEGLFFLDDPNYKATQKLQRMFKKLDPYLYSYLKSKVVQ